MFFLIYCILFSVLYPQCESPIKVIIPSFNNKNWYKLNLSSIFSQNYSNYEIIYIDDCSTDDTSNLVEKFMCENNIPQKKFKVIKNKHRVTALNNIYCAIHKYCEDYDIIAIVDGDDWLAHDSVLKDINNMYKDTNIWSTYGTYADLDTNSIALVGNLDPPITYPKNSRSIQSFDCFVPGHLHTFYAWLFKKIHLKDLFFEGEIAKASYDGAIYIPLMEMGFKHTINIKNITYIHNVITNANDHKINGGWQRSSANYFITKNAYQEVKYPPEKYYINPSLSLITLFEADENFINSANTFINGSFNILNYKTENLLNNLNSYVAVCKDNHIRFTSSVSLKEKIKILESTKALNISLIRHTNQSNILNNFLGSTVFNLLAIQYSNNSIPAFNMLVSIYRKSDLINVFKNKQDDLNHLIKSIEERMVEIDAIGLF